MWPFGGCTAKKTLPNTPKHHTKLMEYIPLAPRNIQWDSCSQKYEFVSWDDEIPNMMGKIKCMFQTTNQYISLTISNHFFTIINHY